MHLYVDSRYISPYAMFVFVTLHEKNKANFFDITTIDLEKGEQKQGEFAKLSMTQRVPMYEEDGFALTESTAILEYLEEKHDARQAYPLNREERARARQLQGWFRTDLQALRKERPTTGVFYKLQEKPAPLSPEAQADADQLFAVANTLLVPGEQFLFGKQWGVLDVELALMLQRLIKAGDPVPENLVQYANFQWQRPSVQWWVKKHRPPL